jgi:predicted RNase H-like HicB family nuclease
MNKFIYSAVFEPDIEAGGYVVTFHDLPVVTEGDTIAEAHFMATEALGAYIEMCLDDGDELPNPTPPNEIKPPEGGFVSLINVDMLQFKIQYSNKAVKKTLTIPEWLNNMAEAKHINFSAALQRALREDLKF